MRTNARLERKENELKTQQCQIDRIIELSREEYLEFSRNLLSDYEFIWDNKDEMYIDIQGISHCLLVLGKDITDGLLIESEGASFYDKTLKMESYARNSYKNQPLRT